MKKNILFLIDQFSFGGGIEKVLSDLSLNFPTDKYNHYIVTCYEAKTLSKTRKILKWKNNAKEIYNLGFSFHSNVLKYLRNYYFGKRKLIKLKKKLKIDVSISIGYFSNEVNIASKKKDKVILTIHEQKNHSLGNKIRFRKFKRADKVIGVSKGVTTFMEKFKIHSDNLITLYNPFDFELIRNIKPNNFCDNTDFNIINIGRIERQKGQWILVDIMKEVLKEIPNAKLHIFGEGNLRKKINQKIKDNDLCENIKIYNFKTNILEYLKSCDLFLSSSLFEGFPLVLCESIISNIPIVAPNFKYGADELLKKNYISYDDKIEFNEYDNGFVTKAFDIDLKEMEDVSENTIKLISKAVVKSYKKEYNKSKMDESVEYLSMDKCINSWVTLIEQLVNNDES